MFLAWKPMQTQRTFTRPFITLFGMTFGSTPGNPAMFQPRSPRSPSPHRIRPAGQGALQRRLRLFENERMSREDPAILQRAMRKKENESMSREDPLRIARRAEWNETLNMMDEDRTNERWLGLLAM
jgi:hypothetical protein